MFCFKIPKAIKTIYTKTDLSKKLSILILKMSSDTDKLFTIPLFYFILFYLFPLSFLYNVIKFYFDLCFTFTQISPQFLG